MTTAEVTRRLERRHLTYELIPHAHTERALDEASALGVAPGEIGKTLVLCTEDGYVRAVLPASRRIDLRKVRNHLGGGKEIHLATEAELVSAYPAFELGAVPPFGGPHGDKVIVDERLAAHDTIIVEAGTHEQSVRLQTSDLLALTGAELADICVENE